MGTAAFSLANNPMIDTHCHIDDPQYAGDMDRFLHTQQEADVNYILVPGIDASSIQSVGQLADRYPDYLLPALGLHPENIQDDWQKQLSAIHDELFHPHRHYIAIGEIGLDYYWDTTRKQEQQTVLHTQMQWAEQLQLPVMIHCRDAIADTLHILRQYPNVKGVFHCFSSNKEIAQQIIGMGYLLGIGGVLTFKNCKLPETLTHIPLNKLLLETDAPYMAPVPHRGQRNESRWMIHVVNELARIYNCTPQHINQVTNDNAKLLFGIK